MGISTPMTLREESDSPFFHRYGVGDVITDAVGHVGPLQGEIGLRVGRIDPGLDGGGAVDQRHHLPHDDIPLAVEELEADFGQRQGFFGVDEIAFGGGNTCSAMAREPPFP